MIGSSVELRFANPQPWKPRRKYDRWEETTFSIQGLLNSNSIQHVVRKHFPQKSLYTNRIIDTLESMQTAPMWFPKGPFPFSVTVECWSAAPHLSISEPCATKLSATTITAIIRTIQNKNHKNMDNEKNRKHELQEKNTDSFSNFLIAIRVTSSKTCKVSKCAISAAASSGVQTLGFGFRKTNFTGLAGNPKNGGFTDDFPFQTGDSQVTCDLQGFHWV